MHTPYLCSSSRRCEVTTNVSFFSGATHIHASINAAPKKYVYMHKFQGTPEVIIQNLINLVPTLRAAITAVLYMYCDIEDTRVSVVHIHVALGNIF